MHGLKQIADTPILSRPLVMHEGAAKGVEFGGRYKDSQVANLRRPARASQKCLLTSKG